MKGSLEYLGKYNGNDAYTCILPEDVTIGFPFVCINKDNKVTVITGFEALNIISLFIKE